jgi:hypothetical protein
MAKQLSERAKTFCRLVCENVAPYRAYELAGYRKHRSNCYRLSENERVRQQIQEEQAMTLKRHEITVDTLLGQLEEARQNAKTLKQPASEVSAVKLAKHHPTCPIIPDLRRITLGQPRSVNRYPIALNVTPPPLA